METILSGDQTLLRDSLRDFLRGRVTFDRVRALERDSETDAELWRELAGLGWLGLVFPEDAGGGGGTVVDLALATEEVARVAAVVPYAEVMAAGLALARFGAPDLAGEQMAAIQQGQALVPAVLDAGDSYDSLLAAEPTATTLSGERQFVDYAPFATTFLVRTGDGLSLVPAGEAGVHLDGLHGITRLPAAHVRLDGAPARVATGPDGYAFLLELMRVLSAVQCLGYAQVAADMSFEYVRNRVQFGRPIGSFQAVQHHCANMALLNQAARFLVYEAAWAIETGSATPGQIATAKAFAARSAIEVTALAHQLHGGIGVTEEYDLHFFSRRAKERAMAWGTGDECLRVVASSVAEPVDWS